MNEMNKLKKKKILRSSIGQTQSFREQQQQKSNAE